MSTSITEIGGPSTANIDQKVVGRIKGMFASSNQQGGGFGMISVPAHLRKVDEQAFTPLLISIGPIHLSNVQLQSTKKYKVRLCESFLQWIKMKLEDLVPFVRSLENEIHSYYAENIFYSMTREDFLTMILVDAMFIFGYFCNQVLLVSDLRSNISIPDWMHPFFKLDMVLLENQLPFSVLVKLFERTFSNEFKDVFFLYFVDKYRENFLWKKPKEKLLLRFAMEFFQCYNFQRMSPKIFIAIMNIENFTDLVRLFHLNLMEGLPNRSFGGAKLSYSATQLHEAGVKFKAVKFDEAKQPSEVNRSCLEFLESQEPKLDDVIQLYDKDRGFNYRRWFQGVKFDEATQPYEGYGRFLDLLKFDSKNGVLEIPCITLNAAKIRLIRNISALEQSLYVGHAYFTDFFVILDFLIDTPKDVDLLCDKGILINYLGDSNAAASVINSLNTNSLWDSMNSDYSKICEELNVFYKKPWHRWRATLWRQYFSTPWRATSTSAAIILLLLTLVQTVCSLKSTIW